MSKTINHILIFAGSDINDPQWIAPLAEKADMIICADSGLCHAHALGITPDHLVGDFDSLSDEQLKQAEADPDIEVHYMLDQNSTDFQKALFLTEAYPEADITVVGALGGRLDHQLANLLSLDRFSNHSRIVLRDKTTAVRVVDQPCNIIGKTGDIVGVIPLHETIDLSYDGLQYEAEGLGPPYKLGWLGTSNSMIKNKARIEFKRGLVMVIHINSE